MSLINCPECNKEISDKAKRCPNCGYKVQTIKKSKRIINIIIPSTICFVIVIFMITILKWNKITDPFEKLNLGMKRDEVHDVLGMPEHVGDNGVDYYKTKCGKFDGMLSIWYTDRELGIVKNCYWVLSIPHSESIDKYSEFINDITDYYTEKYGEPEIINKYTVWENLLEQKYKLRLYDFSNISAVSSDLENAIELTYEH